MNAKQVADELENIYWIQGDGKGKPFQQYADIVRQQQSEIEALKAKTLTDEEIKEFITVFPIIFTPMDLLGFARAILRKAQEK